MAWSTLAATGWVSYADLQDSVNTGVFNLRAGQTIPSTQPDRFITCDNVPIWLEARIVSAPWPFPVIDATQWPQKSWIQPDIPVVIGQIINLGSPLKMFWNPVDHLMYYLELDSMFYKPASAVSNVVNGSIGWFDPLTALTIDDLTYSYDNTAIQTHGCNVGVYNPANNTIYGQGYHSRGLVCFNCATKTAILIPYGTDNSSSHGEVYLVGNLIYAAYTTISGFKVLDTTTNTLQADFIPVQTDPISGLTTHHTEIMLVPVSGNRVWIFYAASSTSGEFAYAKQFDMSDLTTPLRSVPNLSTAVSAVGRYSITPPKLDFESPNPKIWFSSMGNKTLLAFDADTGTDSIPLVSIAVPTTRNYTGVKAIRHDQTSRLFFSGSNNDSISDVGDVVTYVMNTTANTIASTVSGTSFAGDFIFNPDNNKSWGTSPGVVVYNTPNTDYDRDGKILIYS